MRLALALGGISLLVVACHKEPTGSELDGSIGGGSDAAVGSDFQMLISRSWTVGSNTEAYKCVRVQVPADMWISAFRSKSPVGTDHSVLTISTTNTMVGEYDCDSSSSSLDSEMLYAAGVATDDNYFPDGVAIKVAAGTYVNLNLHLFNTTGSPITDTSGVLVKTMAATDVVNEADMQFSGRLEYTIPANSAGDTTTVTSASNACPVAHDFHVFALWPHMHQIAVHQTFNVTGPSWGVSGTNLLDTDYQFDNQKNHAMTDTLVHTGDSINTTCDYINTTGATVQLGSSPSQEMCLTGIYRYPAGGDLFACAKGHPI